MKKLFLVLILFLPLLFSSCVFLAVMESKVPSSVKTEIDKTEISIGEEVTISGIMTKAFHSKKPGETVFVMYLENYPEDYEILEGTFYEATTTEKYLCVKPVPYGSKDFYGNIEGIVKIKMSFSSPGEYTLRLNGFCEPYNKIGHMWGDKYTTHVVTVKE